MVKKLRKLKISIAILGILIVIAIFVSATKFKVDNPFAQEQRDNLLQGFTLVVAVQFCN